MNPRYPVYIVSKGRWETRFTSKALHRMGVPHFMVVEAEQHDEYAAAVDDSCTLLVLDKQFQADYDPCDGRGFELSKGSGPARNFAWEHSIANGAERHWLMDDNIRAFHRLNNNLKVPVADGTVLAVMEDFVDRYANVAMAGPNYLFFAKRKQHLLPYIPNTRIFSCNLILNRLPYRWRARYNEDLDLSLRILKDRWCTVLFNAFLQQKAATMTVKGGNYSELYSIEGTKPEE